MSLRSSANEMFLFGTFLLLIVAGCLILKMPFVHYNGGLSWIDAIFLATSAVCVTGLATVPISGFDIWGQLTLLLLMQLGALGIMTFASSVLLVLKGELNLYHRLGAAKMTGSYSLREIEGILSLILKYTLLTELLGLVFLSIGFLLEGHAFGESLYLGLFHTISAFCNAGFSSFDGSLVGMNPLIKMTIAILIIMGGIGYYVVFDVVGYIKDKDRLTIHTKTVLWGSLFLVVFGTAALLLFENDLSLLDAFFQSVTARTAGFNTVDLLDFRYSSLFLILTLMIIGAAPGSTGGGVKLTTFFVSILAVYNIILGRNRIVLFGRKLPNSNVLKAYALIVLYLSFLAVETVLLLHSEGRSFIKTLFEVVSAVGTVGLSLGLTAELSPFGKGVIILGMFVGRVGPVAMALVFLLGEKESRIDYPEEKIILG